MRYFIVLLVSLSFFSSTIVKAQPFGIKVCGPEFGQTKFPGVYAVDFIYPDSSELQYFYNKGFKMIDLPFRWERVQPKIFDILDSAEIGRLHNLLNTCNNIGLKVKLTLQNFGRYTLHDKSYVIGSKQVPSTALADVWKKLVYELKNHENIYGYQIMNEPHDMFEMSWLKIAQESINAIRTIDEKHIIFVSGSEFSNSVDWKINNDELKKLTDRSDNLVFEAHCYFDRDFTGRYLNAKGGTDNSYDYNINSSDDGVEAIKPFVKWLKKNNKKGFVGEYGVPDDDPRWLLVLDKFLAFIKANAVNGSYWAAGPWWGDYKLSIEPRGGKDRPQMQVLLKYLSLSNN